MLILTMMMTGTLMAKDGYLDTATAAAATLSTVTMPPPPPPLLLHP